MFNNISWRLRLGFVFESLYLELICPGLEPEHIVAVVREFTDCPEPRDTNLNDFKQLVVSSLPQDNVLQFVYVLRIKHFYTKVFSKHFLLVSFNIVNIYKFIWCTFKQN